MPVHVILATDPLPAEVAAADCPPEGVELRRYYSDELDYEKVFDQLGSGGLFDDQQAFHYVDFLGLKFKKKEQEAFLKLAAGLPAETTLVCSQVVQADGRKKLTQAKSRKEITQLAALGRLTDLTHLGEADKAASWLRDRARHQYGLELNPRQASDLLHSCALSLSLADAELRKLSLLKQDDKLQRVADNVMNQLISQIPYGQFFKVADAITGASPEALTLLREWYDAEGETFRLIGELRRRLLGLSDIAAGKPVMPPFFERQLKGFARRYQGPRLGQAVELLAELEFSLKTGQVPGTATAGSELAALEVFTRRLAQITR